MAFNSLFGKTLYFLFYNIPVSKIIHSAFLIGYKNGRNNNDFNMLSSVWRPKNPVSLIFSCLFFSLQYKNLEKPYPTNCTKRSLKAYTSYTVEGCFFECKAEIITKKCGCRLSGYTGMMLRKTRKNKSLSNTPKPSRYSWKKKGGKIEEERKTKE